MHEIHPAYLRQLASAAESRSVDGALAVRTGIASNTENGVVSTAARLEPEVIADLLEWLAIVRDCGWFDDVEPARRLYEGLGYEGLYLAEHGAASAFFAPATVLLNTVAV
ncbi:MAG TPA: hypothetical protein VJ375_02365, partial [Gaiellaceae bacterium]|nr:hypothetical protein [Gaiellaceae bacterium]